MKHTKFLRYLVVLAIIFLANCECLPPQPDGGTITIASFNIQVFGQTKASKPEVMEILLYRSDKLTQLCSDKLSRWITAQSTI